MSADMFDVCGRPLTTAADHPIALERPDAWLVTNGRVDVYATVVDDGQVVGRRQHLCRVPVGESLFGAAIRGPAGLTLIAVGGPGTTVTVVDGDTLHAAARRPEYQAEVARLLDAWIDRICGGLVNGLAASARPKHGASFPAPGAEAIVGGGPFMAARTCWITLGRGDAYFLSRPEAGIAAGELVPVGGGAWLDASPGSLIARQSTAAALHDGAAWGGVRRLHGTVLECTHALLASAATAERVRLAAKASAGHATMSRALAGLASAAGPAGAVARTMRERQPGTGPQENFLLAASRLVARASGIETRVMSGTEGGATARDPLRAIARASRFRTRAVALRGAWWHLDAGPLLARRTRNGSASPVALLPGRKRGYTLHDPETREVTPVTPALAAELEPFAHTFYRPFPDAALGMWDVVRFGLRGCERDLATVVGMGLIIGILGTFAPLATGMLFDSIIPAADRGQLVQLTCVLVACALAAALLQITRSIAMQRIESRMGAAVQAAVWDRLLALPMPFFRPYAAGDLAVRAMGIDEIRRTLSGAVVAAVLGGLFSVFNYALMFRYDAGLAGWATALILVSLAATVAASYLQLRSQRDTARLRSRTSGLVLQLLTGVAKLKTSGAEVHAFDQWARLFGQQRMRQIRARAVANVHATFNTAFPLLASLTIFYIAGTRPQGQALGTGAFLAFVAAFNLCLMAALSAGTALVGALAAVPLYEQAQPILATLPETGGGKNDPGDLAGTIDLHHLSFRYRADGPAVLRDVSVRIRAGEFVAFVGPSGSGKSTIMRLLLGFEHPESGTIAYDEQDLDGLDIQAVRSQIGVVLQSGRLMSGDIYTNIVGSSAATLDEAWEAARMAGLDDDLRSFPMGMHTVVSEGGGGLSGGQRQRLLIARAIVNRPRILLFDEATSALDNRTQEIVSRSLDGLRATRVVIAHRLSTIVRADRICVVQAGQIVEEGTYAELMTRGGVFTELARRQIA